MLYSSFFLPAPSTPTLHCLCCISCNYHTCFKIMNILNLSDFKRLSNPKILQSALFCFWESSPPGRVLTKQFQKADSLFKGWALSASSSCIVCLLLDLRLLLLLLFLGSMQRMKWCLFIYWFLFFWSLSWNTRSPEEKLPLWLIPGTSCIPASTNMIKRTFFRAPVIFYQRNTLAKLPVSGPFCFWKESPSWPPRVPGTSWDLEARFLWADSSVAWRLS